MNLLANKNNIKPDYTYNLFPKFSTASILNVFWSLLFILLANNLTFAQQNFNELDTTKQEQILNQNKTTNTNQLAQNSTLTVQDSTSNSMGLNAKVDYVAKDSIRFDLRNKKVYLYNEAVIDYQTIKLEAADVKIHFTENILLAEGVFDSLGKLVGKPVFTEDEQVYKSKYMKYNYSTKKAIIREVFTESGEGFMHGKTIKKLANENINVKNGSFTTCNDEEHPHFEFRYKKSKIIPNNKIVTGPAYLVIEGVPTPLFIPFGLFPNKPGQRSGVVIPTYGESSTRGFYLEEGGYYFAISDYLDLKLTGDIYTYGSWAIKTLTNYIKKYKYNGSLNITYAVNKERDDKTPRTDFAFRWKHAQDAKARPNSRFTANVNIVSSQYNVYNPTSTQDYLSSSFQSGISYQTKIAGKHSLTLNASHNQNTQTKIVSITLPELSFSVNRFYPFRKKDKVGNLKWYDNISVNYTMNAKNTISEVDSLLFKPGFVGKLKNGMNQKIPISLPIKLFKYFNLTTSINITDRVYLSSLKKTTEFTTDEEDNVVGNLITDTVSGINNILEYSLSSSLTTKIYGMLNFKKGPVRALRHVFTPSISFSYTPDFSSDKWGYYDYYYTDQAQTQKVKYSKFDKYIYGGASNRERGSINFSFSNNLEMKVPSRKDTITGLKKVVLIESLSISTNYNLTVDSLNWAPVSVSGRTTLFKKLTINYASTWSPYAIDQYGMKVNQFEWDFRKKLLRLESTRWSFGFNYKFSSKENKSKKDKGVGDAIKDVEPGLKKKGSDVFGKENSQEYTDVMNNPDDYVDWSIPWSVNLSYSLSKNTNLKYVRILEEDGKYDIEKTKTKTQTISINGDINITKKTKIGFRTGYDFESKEVSYTSLNIYRDLHCWEMRFNWIPIGPRKSWNFTIAIKSTLLQDLKLEKRKDFRDR